MSAPHSPLQLIPGGAPADTSPDALFTAFREGHQKKHGLFSFTWFVAAAVPLLLAVGFVSLWRVNGTTFSVITPHGIKMVRAGMSTQEVHGLLGSPLTLQKQGDQDCYRYGRPNFQNDVFVVYSVCYEEGRVRDVLAHQYSAWQVDPTTGAFLAPGQAPSTAPPAVQP
ncbi:outer membrane protein assembly factor BamE [Corallococcus llansteffanensis]|uniref:outer membrane protein assembly factor BamE n=1 Tax=Corallococcus llansteffanensis TaxID=2316731 RepID=UPI0011C397BB|nr:outer membrane protein assembly factor BamE [Corallococcus llansteffanensis]